MFPWEGNDSDKLSFKSDKVGSNDANRNSKGFSERLKFAHFLFHIDLNDGGSFEDVCAFVKLNILGLVFFSDISLFDDGNRLTSQSALVDKSRSLQDNALKRELDGIFQEDNVAGYNIN